MALEDFTGAEAPLLKAIEYLPTHVGTWHVLAWHALSLKKLDTAEAYLTKAMALDRNFADTHATLAVIDIWRNNLDGASHKLQVALRLNAESQTAQYAKALYLEAIGQDTEATEVMMESLNKPLPKWLNLAQTTAKFKQQKRDLEGGVTRNTKPQQRSGLPSLPSLPVALSARFQPYLRGAERSSAGWQVWVKYILNDYGAPPLMME